MMTRLRTAPRLTVRRLGDELLVMAQAGNRVHHLDAVSALVWRAIENGADADELADAATELGGDRFAVDADQAAWALSGLRDAGLVVVDERMAGHISRRALLTRAAIVSGAAVTLPVISSLGMPAAADTGSNGNAQSNVPAPGDGFAAYTPMTTTTYIVTAVGGAGAGGGAGSGGQAGGAGGRGATVSAMVTVPGGMEITLSVGSGGKTPTASTTGGAGGQVYLFAGGAGGSGAGVTGAAGGGGAYSGIFVQGELVLIAGGGGGGGGGGLTAAGGAGTDGGTSQSSSTTNGSGSQGAADSSEGGGGAGAAPGAAGTLTATGGAGGGSNVVAAEGATVSDAAYSLSGSGTITAAGADGADGSLTITAVG